MKICGLLSEDHIFFGLKSGDKALVLAEFVKGLKERNLISDDRLILEELLKRESLGSTGLERGIAIPHALTHEIEQSFLAVALFPEGIDFEAVDQMPTHVLLMLLGNKEEPGAQLKLLAHVCRLVKETEFVEKTKHVSTAAEICRILEEEEAKII